MKGRVISVLRDSTVFLFVTSLGFVEPASAAKVWASIGPSGGTVHAVAIDPQTPTTIYVGTNGDLGGIGGVFKSVDQGATWHSVGPANTTIRSLAIDPSTPTTLYAADDGHGIGVLKSTDGGASWTGMKNGLAQPFDARQVLIDPFTPTTLYAVVAGRLYTSTDGAASWTVAGGLFSTVREVAVDPTTPGVLFAATFAGINQSLDGGATWRLTSFPPQGFKVVVAPTNPETIYATTREDLFVSSRTTDGGNTWNEVVTGLGDRAIIALAVDPQTPGMMFAGTSFRGIIASRDGGLNWSTSNDGFVQMGTSALAINPSKPRVVYAGTLSFNGGAVFRSDDGGDSWRATTLTNANISGLTIDPQTPKTLYAHVSGSLSLIEPGLYKTRDGGNTWLPILADAMGPAAIDPWMPTTLYAPVRAGVAISLDGGGNWAVSPVGFDEQTIQVAVDPLTPTTLYACTSPARNFARGRVWKSTDGGGSWMATTLSSPGFGTDFTSIVIDPLAPSNVYVSVVGMGVFKSTDSGDTWSASNTGLTNLSVNALALSPKTPNILFAGTTGGDGVFKSTDSGSTWVSRTTQLDEHGCASTGRSPSAPECGLCRVPVEVRLFGNGLNNNLRSYVRNLVPS